MNHPLKFRVAFTLNQFIPELDKKSFTAYKQTKSLIQVNLFPVK